MVTREGQPVEDSPHSASWPRAPEFLFKGKSAEATGFAQEYCHKVLKLHSQVLGVNIGKEFLEWRGK